ncbi:DUF2971 domain-containing protein [Rhodopseudomonas sp. BR0C11]|uniref:DUF2971 domain-containing protein n=1 Tax=Rhodopseudomonas sp. BR0C11 TaxID=2269370 RepID=UPI0013DF8280|nr:DUF2971 domain-containing protein [Rhodopseudomonas sp. BR0C11]NEV78790.1 DUF2971 domain-containing protein [Rhodopseudomonas sp. BR0C11]
MAIGTDSLSSKQPELFHYTSLTGFEAILESQQLWATHFRDLNDTTEVYHLKEPLREALERRFNELLIKRQQASIVFSLELIKYGGREKNANILAENFTNSLYRITYGDKTHIEFGSPYITSFSTPNSNHERAHGLLSQWRAYGRGGYCLVFDTEELAQLLSIEWTKSSMIHANLAEVIYGVDDFPIDDLLGLLLHSCQRFLDQVFDRRRHPDSIEDGLPLFVSTTTLFKHQGFREENEVRMVIVPTTQRLSERLKQEPKGPQQSTEKLLLEPQTVLRSDGRKRRYVNLFAKTERALPITRIIVGPGPDQEKRHQRARELLGPQFKILDSDIPLAD